MKLSSSHLSPMADVSQSILTTRQWRRLVARRRRERRGIILIFVIVLLMLLAIMGTAYLATSRADRIALRGNGALAGTTVPPPARPQPPRHAFRGDANPRQERDH